MKWLNPKNRWMAAVALFLAIVTYFYVKDALNRGAPKTADSSYKLIKPAARSIPIKVRFASNPPPGYRLIMEKVAVNPARLVVIGPEVLLDEMSSAETAILDVSQSTKRIVKDIPVESVAGIHLTGDPFTVEVVVPIEKIEVNR